jgi:selenobiotic family peptide radical SAM maturase
MEIDFPGCRAVLNPEAQTIFDTLLINLDDAGRCADLKLQAETGRLPAFLPDLFRLEQAVAKAKGGELAFPAIVKELTINPTLELVRVEWTGLDQLLSSPLAPCSPRGATYVLVWQQPVTLNLQVRQAETTQLLALKVVAEGLSPELIAKSEGISVCVVDAALHQAVTDGLILRPPSAICRHQSIAEGSDICSDFLSAEVFTMQWHITQACDLHCKHCYDRTNRESLALDRALQLLDEFREFCRGRFVQGQVTFTGGNPLLHPHFLALYRGAIERYLGVAILGNPAPRQQIEMIIGIAKPLFYQVSLEGLEAHNDCIRGPGHFARVIDFLELLKELGVYSMVMLTLTRENQGQVLPLAELLRDKVDLFTFNRLAMVGEGASLLGPEIESYRSFLAEYRQASQNNSCLGLKDNLLNLLASETADQLFGGCAGHGCGAAFNFVSVLADGEVHACRKFPSPIGNVLSEKFATIYDALPAKSYRQGCVACRGCRIWPLCGGCLAVVHGMGFNPLQDRDPYCWQQGPEVKK